MRILPGINPGEKMIKSHWFFAACCILALLFCSITSAAVYTDSGGISVSIKYNNGVPTVGEEAFRAIRGKSLHGAYQIEEAPVDPEKEMINVITITKGDIIETKNIQTPKVSNVYVRKTITDDTDVMQTTNEPGYPVLEIYWGYDKSGGEPWRYYMRVNNAMDTKAVYSDFRTKVVWTVPIRPDRTSEIISYGTIPEWGTV